MNLILATDIELLLVGMWKGQAFLANSLLVSQSRKYALGTFICIYYIFKRSFVKLSA